MNRTARLSAIVACALLSACANPSKPVAEEADSTVPPTVILPRDVIESVEPWTFHGAAGQIIRTTHYRIFTTERDAILTDRLPRFLEVALMHYRTSLTPLPPPRLRLDTYLMDNRPQWARLTQQLLGAEGERFAQIQRGGFATRGVGVFYDIGVFDTLAVAAHEGWHQYTQRAFRERLPIWLEEGLASFMEGHKWDGAEPLFLPWANIQRFDQLRKAHGDGRLLSLAELAATAPQDSAASAGESLVTYYAQVWALAHFLNEGDGGRYRAGLRAMLEDAAQGRFRRTLLVRLGRSEGARAISTGRGAGALTAYLDVDLEELGARYRAFLDQVVTPGSRDRIVAGRSPLREEGS